jgi:hypothetical protein
MHAALLLAPMLAGLDKYYRPGPSPAPFIGLMILGFAVGLIGHLTRLRLLVGVGVVMIFAATVLLPFQYAGEFR